MSRILVTGATGQLGTPTLAILRARGADAVGISRRGGGDVVAADLLTGDGVPAALDGVDTLVHAATTGGHRDVAMAERLFAAALEAGVAHVVLVSIVGIDQIPLGFYRDRVRIEEIARASGVPVTIQRATQFHSFVERLFTAQRRMPVILAPAWQFQPIAVTEVAERLAGLAGGVAQGRADDIGGPEVLTIRELYSTWSNAVGTRRRMLPVTLPGKAFRAFAGGANLVPGTPYGAATFAQHLAG